MLPMQQLLKITALNITILIITALSSGCSSIKYYAHMLGGQLEISSSAKPIPEIIDNLDKDEKLRAKLQLIQSAKQFANTRLNLPQNESYSEYADLGRQYVLWNVTAAPQLSLTPYKSCFPIVGCMNYRGFFSKESADEFAQELKTEGYDVYVAGVAAFSSLGWFNDPVLNTMIHWPDSRLAGLIFHELTHQKLYIDNDTSFNESLAVTVEIEGIKLWLKQQNKTEDLQRFLKQQQRQQQFLDIVFQARNKLIFLYQTPLSDKDKAIQKQLIFAGLLKNYQKLKQSWNGYSGYDRWLNHDLNNAKLALLATYSQYVPALTQLLQQHNYNFNEFFSAAEKIAKLPQSERAIRLKSGITQSN